MEIIAEIGQNHNGDMQIARRLIAEAKAAGAAVAKFQVYDARALFPKEGNEWFDYNCKTELSRTDVETLARDCEREGIEFMASVFDVARVAWLEAVGMRRYKLASRSVKDRELIEAVTRTGKPVLVSLGMWDGTEFPDIAAPGGVGIGRRYRISRRCWRHSRAGRRWSLRTSCWLRMPGPKSPRCAHGPQAQRPGGR